MNYCYPFKYTNEVFKSIPPTLGFRNIYIVGNCGTVFNTETGQEMPLTMDPNGYVKVSLQYADGSGSYAIGLHRLVMLVHYPIPNASEMTVNHISGKKENNRYDNLEWLSSGDNTRHAFDTGLTYNTTQRAGMDKLTNTEVTQICSMLSKGVPFKDIAMGIGREPTQNLIRTIRAIHDRVVWKFISKDYEFPEYPNLRNSMTEDQARIACQILSQGGSYKDILRAFGIDPDSLSKEELYNFCDIISNLRMGRYYSNISKEFGNLTNDQKARHDQLLTFDEIHLVCKLLASGCDVDEIINTHLHYTLENTDKSKINKIRSLIYRIRRKVAYTAISSQYGL